MAFKVDENLLSLAARDYLNNSKCKAKAVRQAIEFFVTYRASLGGSALNIDVLDSINDKLDNIIKLLTTRPSQTFPSSVESSSLLGVNIKENTELVNSVNKEKESVSTSHKTFVSVTVEPSQDHNVIDNQGFQNGNNNDDLFDLALSSITNILGDI